MVVAYKSFLAWDHKYSCEGTLQKKNIWHYKNHKEDEWENEGTSIIQPLVKEYFVQFIYFKVFKSN